MHKRRFRESYKPILVLQRTSQELFTALKQCAAAKELELGKYIHRRCKDHHLVHSDVVLSNTFLELYTKCGDMRLAKETFDGMTNRNVVTWTCIILGYVENGESLKALDLFDKIDCQPDTLTYVAVIKACTKGQTQTEKLALLERGIAIHKQVKSLALERNVILASSLVDMYRKCGNLSLARELFQGMTKKNIFSWTSLLLGYVENGESLTALELFKSMDLEPDHVMYIAVLKACASLSSESHPIKQAAFITGFAVHERLRHRGFDTRTSVANTLIDMYSKHGNMLLAKEIFDQIPHKDVVSWNCLLLGYVENEQCLTALELFRRMAIKPDHITFICALKACGSLAGDESFSGRKNAVEECVLIHRMITEQGLGSNAPVSNTLLDTYIKCGDIRLARKLFARLRCKDVVTWNCLIMGYAENGEAHLALELLNCMDCEPDRVTYVAALKAYGCSTLQGPGRLIHGTLCKLGLEDGDPVATTLVDFYGKCGCMNAALEVFSEQHTPSVASWNALLTGYSSTGDSRQVLGLVRGMEEAGVSKDAITFIAVLTACSHAGMVEEGKKWFEAMRQQGITPTLQHYTCMADMLGRANLLQEAVRLVDEMPYKANEVTWMSLLVACRKWNKADVGKVAFNALIAKDCESSTRSAAYVLMAGISSHYDICTKKKAHESNVCTQTCAPVS